VPSLAQTLLRLRQRIACAGLIVSCLVTAVVMFIANPLVSRAQDTTSDVIAARKLLMDSIMNNMDKIQEMISERRIDPDVSREAPTTSSRCLWPSHILFPPSSNQWKRMSISTQ
jgi:hypothetical protein